MKLIGYLCMGVVLGFAIAWMVLPPIPALPPVPAPVYQVGGSEYIMDGFHFEQNNGRWCTPPESVKYGGEILGPLNPATLGECYVTMPEPVKRPRHRRKAHDAGTVMLDCRGGHIEGVTGPLGTIFNDSLTPDVLGDGPQGDAYTLEAPVRWQWKPNIWCSILGKEQVQWPSRDGTCSVNDKAFPQPKPQ